MSVMESTHDTLDQVWPLGLTYQSAIATGHNRAPQKGYPIH